MIKVLMNLPKNKFLDIWTKGLNGEPEEVKEVNAPLKSFPPIFNFPTITEKKQINPFGNFLGKT